MPWYHFQQNNSGGFYSLEPERGVGHNVWVEARDAEDANRRAESIGIYFNGCSNGRDCDCCGDRWSSAYAFGEDKGDFDDFEYYGPSEGRPVYLHPLVGSFIALTHDDPHEPADVLRLVEDRTHARDEEFVRQWIAKHGIPAHSRAEGA